MKQKRTFITLLLILAILALGIAYAAISNQMLTISGNVVASALATNFNVNFTGVPETSGDGTTLATIDELNNKLATINVSGLTTKGQKAIAKYEVENSSTEAISALLSTEVTYDNTTWFNVTTTIEEADKIIEQNGKTTITVEVELLQTPATSEDEEAAQDEITVTLIAAPQSK